MFGINQGSAGTSNIKDLHQSIKRMIRALTITQMGSPVLPFIQGYIEFASLHFLKKLPKNMNEPEMFGNEQELILFYAGICYI